MTDIADLEKRAEAEDTEAMGDLIYKYRRVDSVHKDEKKAKFWAKKRIPFLEDLSEKGEAWATLQLAFAYFWGDGVMMNRKKARELEKKSKEQEQEND